MSFEVEWEYNCPQFVDFNEIGNDDDADKYFDCNHEVYKLPKFKRVLREVSNTNNQRPNDKSSIKRHLEVKNSVVGGQSPISKKPRMSTPNPIRRKQSEKQRSSLSPGLKQRLRGKKSALLVAFSQPLDRESECKNNSLKLQQDSYKEVDFVSTLRQYSPLRGPAHRLTKPSPFKLTEKPKKTMKPEFQSVAQQILAFQTKTPERFRTKPKLRNGESDNDCTISQHKIPIVLLKDISSPNLLTKQRVRPVTCMSQAEIEEREVEEMKKFQFKALPLNPVIFQRSDIGLHKPEPKPTTVVEPFHFHSDTICKKREHDDNHETFTFHARPIPKGLFDKPQGLPEIVPHPTTLPQSPNFALKSRLHQPTQNHSEMGTDDQTTSSLNSTMSTSSSTSTVKWVPKPTKVRPFSFEQRNQQMMAKKAKKIQEFIEQEKKLREFRALPLPNLDQSGVPSKKIKPQTIFEPFPNQEVALVRRSQRTNKWMQEVKEELEKQKQMNLFKARPCTVTTAAPFIPVKSDRSPVEPSNIELRTEARAKSRLEFEEYLRDKEEEMKRICKQRQEMKEEEEAAALAKWRAENAYHAQPIRRYKPLNSPKQLPLTIPLTPKFNYKKATGCSTDTPETKDRSSSLKVRLS